MLWSDGNIVGAFILAKLLYAQMRCYLFCFVYWRCYEVHLVAVTHHNLCFYHDGLGAFFFVNVSTEDGFVHWTRYYHVSLLNLDTRGILYFILYCSPYNISCSVFLYLIVRFFLWLAFHSLWRTCTVGSRELCETMYIKNGCLSLIFSY